MSRAQHWKGWVAWLLGLAVGLAALWWTVPAPREDLLDALLTADLAAVATPRPSDWDDSLGTAPRFTDITEAAGISFEHVNGHTGRFQYLEIMGAGVGLFDYDGDGYLDIYFVNGNYFIGREPSAEITNQLYHNSGDGTFTDVTARAGVGDTAFGQGCCVGDYDNDGAPDLYVSNYGRNLLYRNRGDGTFIDVAAEAGVDDPAWGQTCSFLDFDRDGWLDLYVQNYLTFRPEEQTDAYIYVGNQKVLDYPTPLGFPGAADRLYRNRGDGTFADVTEKAGIGLSEGKGMGCACVDLNDDGYPDIYVANDTMENYLFINRRDGTFEEVALIAGAAFDGQGIPEASMGVDVGDYDGDGRLDLINPCYRVQSYTLLRNLGDRFVDASWASGITQITSVPTGFSPNFIDYDNDGDLDLFFSTGEVRMNELVPADASYEERYGLRDLLAANDGKGRYTDVARFAGEHFRRRLIGRGSATGDLDNDGDIDLVICNLAGPAVVLRNDTPSNCHWVTLILERPETNRECLGASVRLEAGGRRLRRDVHGAVTYLSQCDRRLHFGLGTADRIDRLEITWPDGSKEEHRDLPVDRFLRIEQGSREVK